MEGVVGDGVGEFQDDFFREVVTERVEGGVLDAAIGEDEVIGVGEDGALVG